MKRVVWCVPGVERMASYMHSIDTKRINGLCGPPSQLVLKHQVKKRTIFFSKQDYQFIYIWNARQKGKGASGSDVVIRIIE